jgi:hypothetical protein
MNSSKILILIMCSSKEPYLSLEKEIKNTWFKIKHPNVKVIFYHDNDKEENKKNYAFLKENDLILPCGDGYDNLGIKTLMCFEWALNYNFDFIYRSNLGAYLDFQNMIKFIENNGKKEKFFCGIIGKYNQIKFASGSGYFMSRDVVELVVEKKNDWNHSLCDDVAVADLLSKFSVGVSEGAKRLNYCDNKKFYEISDKTVVHVDDSEIYHIRLRSENREFDILKMREIYKEKLRV